MTIIEALRELLSDKVISQNGVTEVVLEESDSLAILKKLTLTDLTSQMLIVHIDKGRKIYFGKSRKDKGCAVMSPLFKTEGCLDHNCGCDAVLIHALNSEELQLFYIELKSNSPSGFEKQFQSSKCFFRYLQFVTEEFKNKEYKSKASGRDFCLPQLVIKEEYYVVFHTDPANQKRSLNKQSTRPKHPDKPNSPQEPCRFVVLNGERVRFTQILNRLFGMTDNSGKVSN